MAYGRFVASAEEAGTQGFLNAAEAAKALKPDTVIAHKVPEPVVRAVLLEFQIAQLNKPQTKEGEHAFVEMAGAKVDCDDIRSVQDREHRILQGGYIRASAVESLRPAVDKLMGYVKPDAAAKWQLVAPPYGGYNKETFASAVTSIMLRGEEAARQYENVPREYQKLPLLTRFALDDEGRLHISPMELYEFNRLAIQPRYSGFRSFSEGRLAFKNASEPVYSAFLDRKAGDESCIVNGIPITESNLKMGLGHKTSKSQVASYVEPYYAKGLEENIRSINSQNSGFKNIKLKTRRFPLKTQVASPIPSAPYLTARHGVPSGLASAIINGLENAVSDARGDEISIPIHTEITEKGAIRDINGVIVLSMSDIIAEKPSITSRSKGKIFLNANAVPKIHKFMETQNIERTPIEAAI